MAESINKGAAGIDGQTFADIETYGVQKWIGELAEKAYAAVDNHARRRLRQWLSRKHQVPGQGTSRFPDQYLNEQLKLVQLSVKTRNFPWAKA